MAIMREQEQQKRAMQERMHVIEGERRRVEDLAYQLSQQANVELRKAVEGLIALPAAITVGMAASTLYFVGFVTRGLEIFQTQALEASRRMQELDGADRGEQGRIEERGREGTERRGELGRPEMPTA